MLLTKSNLGGALPNLGNRDPKHRGRRESRTRIKGKSRTGHVKIPDNIKRKNTTHYSRG